MNDVTRQQVLESRDLLTEMESRGVKVLGTGNQRSAKCPFHEDKSPSLSINVPQGVWKCHGGCGSGSVIDFIARMENRHPTDVYRELAAELAPPEPWRQVTASLPVKTASSQGTSPEKVYSYTDPSGVELFQVHRYRTTDGKKTFIQGHYQDGKWVPNMAGVTRVLYGLPEVTKAETVWLCEGEKDVHSLRECGVIATTNPGGSGAWLDSYSDSLVGKDVVYCGDNDKAGAEHLGKVRKGLEGKVKALRIVKVPSPHKDITDYLQACIGMDRYVVLADLLHSAQVLPRGIELPLWTMTEAMSSYVKLVGETKGSNLDLGRWLPSLRHCCRPLIPGDLVTIIAMTAAGKTAALQNIIMAMPDIPTVMFEMELSREAMFERMVGQKMNVTGDCVWSFFESGPPSGIETITELFSNLTVCTSAVTVEKMEELAQRSELILGQPPKLILVDYIQLLGGQGGSRYERFSDIAEGLRRMALRLNAAVIVTCQCKRKENGDMEVFITDGKESGSIENSSSLVLGMWREEMDSGSGIANKTVIRVLKNSRGPSGRKVECHWSPTFSIKEISPL